MTRFPSAFRDMRRRLRIILNNDRGAVTVDWTVLAAAAVGLGLASVAAVRSGVVDLGGDVGASLSGASVAALGTLGDGDAYSPVGCPGGQAGLTQLAQHWHDAMPGAYGSVEDIMASHMDWVAGASDAQVMAYIDSFRPMVAAGMSPWELSYDEMMPWAAAECVARQRGLI